MALHNSSGDCCFSNYSKNNSGGDDDDDTTFAEGVVLTALMGAALALLLSFARIIYRYK